MMQTIHRVSPGNGVLASVPRSELDQVRMLLAPVSLVRRQVLVEFGRPSDHTYFIEHGMASVMVKAVAGEEGVQVAMIGREGMAGDIGIGPERQPSCARVVVTVPGTALRIPTAELQRLVETCPGLQAACLATMRGLMVQVMQTASSNLRRSLLERCARWLVMAHERVEDVDIPVTHEMLSELLCIGRPSITMAVASLQQSGLIQIRRGRMTVLDPIGLSNVANGDPVPARTVRALGDRETAPPGAWAAADAQGRAMPVSSGAER